MVVVYWPRETSASLSEKTTHWDGTWNTVAYSIPEQKRQARNRLRLELNWMGCGRTKRFIDLFITETLGLKKVAG
jgi:DNA-binding transcriptional regulator PaaX